MTFEVSLTAVAERDIEDIWTYIANHDSSERADRVIAALEKKIMLLASAPNLGNVPKELHPLGITDVRELHWKPYRIMYRLNAKRVWVHTVLDGRRDMNTLLQERLMR